MRASILVYAIREQQQDIAGSQVEGCCSRLQLQVHRTQRKARGRAAGAPLGFRLEVKDRPLTTAVKAHPVSCRVQKPDEGGDKPVVLEKVRELIIDLHERG